MPKVSIILPVYNVEKYILVCLKSIIRQSYKNFEIIIVDDCGTDNSMSIIKEYINTLPSTDTDSIHIIKHTSNKGLSAARNTGIKNATGEYIYFIDSDDYISINCINSFINIVKKYPTVDVIFGTAEYVPYKWKNSIISVNSDWIPEFVQETNYICNLFFSKEQLLPTTAWNKLIRKEYISQNKLLFTEGIIYEDNLWNWHIGNTITSIAFNKENTYYYRYVPNSIINKPYSEKNKFSEATIIYKMFRSISPKNSIKKLIYILHYSHSSYCRNLVFSSLPPSYIRYPKAFVFFLKCIFMKPKHLRK